MKAEIYINRHIVAANKKAGLDNPAISINTYLGVIYCKEIVYTQTAKLIQNAKSSRCSGATIWMEAAFESLVIDGVPANRSMFTQKELPKQA